MCLHGVDLGNDCDGGDGGSREQVVVECRSAKTLTAGEGSRPAWKKRCWGAAAQAGLGFVDVFGIYITTTNSDPSNNSGQLTLRPSSSYRFKTGGPALTPIHQVGEEPVRYATYCIIPKQSIDSSFFARLLFLFGSG